MIDINHITEFFKPIKDDNTSGSIDIALKAIRLIRDFVKDDKVEISKPLCNVLSEWLISAQPSMGIILNLAYGLRRMKKGVKRNDILLYLDKYESGIKDHTAIISKRVFKLLESAKTIMVYSASYTVLMSLRYAYEKGLRFKVLVPESRPQNEGRNMALALADLSIPVLYTTDAMAMSMLAAGDIDGVFIGGDAIVSHTLICKVGSLALATICRRKKIPLYGLCGTEKIVPDKLKERFNILPMPSEEIIKLKKKNITVINRYFESVPFKLFTKIITDKKEFAITKS